MDSTTAIIITGLIGAVLGGLIGAIIGLRNGSAGVKARELQQRLDQSERERKSYEQDVIQHFAETASRLNTLTESYREVHNHLAQGAARLCDGRGTDGALQQLARSADDALIPPSLVNVEPPRDYAPKGSPEDPGVLNEAFGLDKNDIASRPPSAGDAGVEAEDADPEAKADPADVAQSPDVAESAGADSQEDGDEKETRNKAPEAGSDSAADGDAQTDGAAGDDPAAPESGEAREAGEESAVEAVSGSTADGDSGEGEETAGEAAAAADGEENGEDDHAKGRTDVEKAAAVA